MLAEERFALILNLLAEKRTATVQELCEALNASESTIRRDLTELDRQGRLNKVHGGATLPDGQFLADEPTMDFLLSGGESAESKYLIVNLALPKFDIASDLDLADSLKSLGITDVFDPAVSDFSPMTDDTAAYLSQAKHAARVTVDEEGVTAAAYTVMMVCGEAAPPEEEVDFVLNRPFVFAITGTDGLPLFAGMTIALACYVILPTGLDLRPYRVYGSDLFAQAVRMLYATDTPLNVCPSIHVFNSVTLMMAYYRSHIFEEPGRRWMRPASAVLCVSIIASTVLLKQHSCIDVLLGILLAMALDTAMTALERSDARALQRL